ncbi:tetratricopeptide repeat protein [Croceicoccus sp. F390]|uniref:Tetratricopeptide repeat protein n=1 Tax=Croceicoccus esteveae TaxID=3075597 RepID=A0ABU2ZIU6_9SPHN|nr:tetratricopeptide repeat protein [Croceicoccus sp. F390]MDT0575327.1 tetratricopeptide repeat protein [Croceicoccus sp. F390]
MRQGGFAVEKPPVRPYHAANPARPRLKGSQLALRPTNPQNRQEIIAQRDRAQQDVFMREVDDAVRQDRLQGAMARFGMPLIILAVVLVVGLGGYVWWHAQQTAAAEAEAVELVLALDRLEAGQLDAAAQKLAPLVETQSAAYRAPAMMARAGIALEQGDAAQAMRLFDNVAQNEDVAQPLRNLATIRAMAAGFDTLDPQVVIQRLQPLAAPGDAFFGSAGELVAMAYLKQGKTEPAGALFAAIAKDSDTPETLRARARQIAGVLGTDAVDDAQEVVDTIARNSAAQQR